MKIKQFISGARWDSKLFAIDRTDAVLKLIINVKLSSYTNEVLRKQALHKRITESDERSFEEVAKRATSVRIEEWNSLDWLKFKKDFPVTVERGWNNKFVLYATKSDINSPTKVKCVIEINLVNSGEHVEFIVARESNKSKRYRSGVYIGRDYIFGRDSYLGYLSSRSLQRRIGVSIKKPSPMILINQNITINQIAVLHEIGHYLFMRHVNRSEGVEHNSALEYGKDAYTFSDLMGTGSAVSARFAQPWQNQIKYHILNNNVDYKASVRSYKSRMEM